MSLNTIKSLKIPLNDIFNDLIQENKRLEEEFEFADKCLSILMEFKDILNCETDSLLIDCSEVKEQELSADGFELLIALNRRYVETVAEKESKDKSKSNSSADIQLYHSLFNKSAEEVNDVFEDLIEYNKQLQRNMINANKQLEIVIKIYDRFSMILETKMSSDNQITSLKLSSDDIFVFITLNEELEQFIHQNNRFVEVVDDNCDQLQTTDTSDSSQDEIQDLENTDEVADGSETILGLNISGETPSDQEIRESLGSDNIEEIIENTAIKDENNWSQEVIAEYGNNHENQELSIDSDLIINPNQHLPVICPEVNCHLKFSSKVSMLAHKHRSHRPNRKAKNRIYRLCDITDCGFSTFSKTAFQAHMNIHSGKYKCNRCNFRAGFLCYLKKHKCQKQLQNSRGENVTNHSVTEVIDNNVGPYKPDLKIHKNSHSVSRVLDESEDYRLHSEESADQSNRQLFHNNGNTDDSIASNDHNESLQTIFKCPENGCSLTFSTMGSSLSHKRRVHCSHINLTRNFCHECKTPLLSTSNFYAHKNIHSGKYKCNRCPYRASFMSTLNRHYQSHDNVPTKSNSVKMNVEEIIEPKTTVNKAQPRPTKYFCPYVGCGRKFSSQKALSIHKSKSHPPKGKAVCRPFRICQTPTYSTNGFHDHMNVHYGKFKCDRCDFRTGSSLHLNKHNCQRSLFAVSVNEDITDHGLSKESVPQDNDDSEHTHRDVSTQTTIDGQIYETDEDMSQELMSESSEQNETIANSSGRMLYKCPDQRCFFESNSKTEFIDHRNSHFRNKISHKVLIFRCTVCSSAYTSKKSLQRHKEFHSYIWCGLNGCQFRATETKELAKHKRNSHNI